MKKKQLVTLMAIAALISACSLSGDDKERIGQAEDNLEKLALEPVITYPAENSTVNMMTEVRVDVDQSVGYEKLILLVNGVEVAEDDEAPFVFQWNPYFVADGSEASLLVKAVTTSGNTLRSKATKMTIDRTFETSQFVLGEVNGGELIGRSFPYGTSEVSLAWGDVQGAEAYELKSGTNVVSSATTLASVALVEGENNVLIRAKAAEQWGRWIELESFWVYPPESPSATAVYDVEAGVVNISTAFADALEPSAVSLIVNGEQAFLLDNKPFEFSWDPYFWASTFSVEWWITATLDDGRLIQSNLNILDKEASGVFDRMQIALPEMGPNYLGVDSLLITWNNLAGASKYEYELERNVGSDVTEVVSSSLVQLEGLEPGLYSLRVRAIDEREARGAWSRSINFSIVVPEAPVITSPALETSFSNVTSVVVEWSPVKGAAGYQYRIDGSEWVAVAGLTAEVPTPNAGYLPIEVQAVDALGRVGERSVLAINVTEPQVPTVNKVFVSWSEDKFDVDISWNTTEEGNTYQIRWAGLESIYETSESSIVLPVAAAGNYSWQFKVINAAGHESSWESQESLNVGIFRTELGGSKDEYASQLLRSSMGGYLVLAGTTSRELDLSVKIDSTQPAPWLLRFDESGNVVNEIILPSPERVEEVIEDEAGNIYLAGYNWQEKHGFVYKLSQSFELLWRREYINDASSERFDITSIASWNDGLVLVGATWKTVSDFSSRDSFELMSVNIENGAIIQRHSLPRLSEDKSLNVSAIKLHVSPNGDLLVGGALEPEVSEFFGGHAFTARVNTEFMFTDRWVSDLYKFSNFGDVVAGESGERLFVVGQESSGGPALAILNAENLGELYVESNYPDEFYYEYDTSISSSGRGGVLTLLSDSKKYSSPRPMVIVEYDELLLEISRTYLTEEQGYTAEKSILLNPDGSVTILFSQKKNGSNNNQLVLKRFPYWAN